MRRVCLAAALALVLGTGEAWAQAAGGSPPQILVSGVPAAAAGSGAQSAVQAVIDREYQQTLVAAGRPAALTAVQLQALADRITLALHKAGYPDAHAYLPGQLVAGTDYLLTPHGIQVLSGTTIDETGVLVDYTPRKNTAVQMLNSSEKEFEIFIAGLNDAQSGEPYALRIRRAKFGLLQEMPILGQDYLKLTGPIELLADPTVVADDISKFLQMDLAA